MYRFKKRIDELMIKAVLFDLDGTLINTNNLIIKSFNHTFKKHLNKTLDEKKIVMFFGEPLKETLARYDRENVDALLKTYMEYNEVKHDELTKSFEGVEDAIKSIKERDIKVGVVTSKRRVMALKGLQLFGLDKLMDVIITPEDTKLHKPNGEPVLKACEVLKISPEEAIMVGDSYYDILCGKNAGAKACLVKYTALPIEEILKYDPDYTIDSIRELVEFIA